jgi:hypothetical protein
MASFFCEQYPPGGRKKTLTSKKSRKQKMAPGGRSKRVRASEQSEEQPREAPTRFSKRLQTQETAGHNDEDPAAANSDVPLNFGHLVEENHSNAGHDTDQADSDFGHHAAAEEDSGVDGLDGAEDDNVAAGELREGKL